MKVLDVIKLACAYLGLYDDFKTYFEPSTLNQEIEEENVLPEQIAISEVVETPIQPMPEEKKEELELLLLSINNIQQKLLKEIPLITKEKIKIDTNKIDFLNLSNNHIRIINIKSKNKKLDFKTFDGYILLNDYFEYPIEVEIEYSYFLPKVSNLLDIINLDNTVKEHTLALGVASEYCYIQALFDDADIWNKKFSQELEIDKQKIRNFIIPKRNWR